MKPIMCLRDSFFVTSLVAFPFDSETRMKAMAGQRRAMELALGEEDLVALRAIARSRTESASRVERARMLLAYWEDPSFFAVGRMMGVHHQTVQRCIERALACGPLAALNDLPRPGREPRITAEAKAWIADLACRKAKELGLSSRIVDDATSRPQCARDKAAQGSLLSGTPRPGVQAEDGGGSVRLSRGEAHQGDGGRHKTTAERCGGDRLL